jgi:hypothetical protein
MKNTTAQDENTERFIALAIAAIYHGLLGMHSSIQPKEEHVFATAEKFRKYIEGK